MPSTCISCVLHWWAAAGNVPWRYLYQNEILVSINIRVAYRIITLASALRKWFYLERLCVLHRTYLHRRGSATHSVCEHRPIWAWIKDCDRQATRMLGTSYTVLPNSPFLQHFSRENQACFVEQNCWQTVRKKGVYHIIWWSVTGYVLKMYSTQPVFFTGWLLFPVVWQVAMKFVYRIREGVFGNIYGCKAEERI